MRASRTAAAFLAGLLIATAVWGVLMVEHSGRDADALADAREQGAAEAVQPVLDRPIPEGNSMPLWLQDDPQWSGVPYAGGTIGDSGCGLVCAAMAVKYMTVQDVTPPMLADAVVDSCITGGVNDPGKFCAWIAEHYPEYGIEHSGILYKLDDALAQVDAGWLAFAGMSGRLGERDYEGHVVLIWLGDGGTYWIRDPASGANSQRAWTREELEGIEWKYFYTIRGGFYGN